MTQPFSESPTFIVCHKSSCPAPATLRREVRGKSVPLCERHAEELRAVEALGNLPRWGLAQEVGETNEAHVGRMRDYFLQAGKTVVKRVTT